MCLKASDTPTPWPLYSGCLGFVFVVGVFFNKKVQALGVMQLMLQVNDY